MEKELKDEILCIAHTSIPCSERNDYTHECRLKGMGPGPYKMSCEFKKVINVPAQRIKHPDDVIAETTKVLVMDHSKTTDDIPF